MRLVVNREHQVDACQRRSWRGETYIYV